MHIHIKIMGKIVKYALVYDGAGLNIYSLKFLQKFGDMLMSQLKRKIYKIKGFDNVKK